METTKETTQLSIQTLRFYQAATLIALGLAAIGVNTAYRDSGRIQTLRLNQSLLATQAAIDADHVGGKAYQMGYKQSAWDNAVGMNSFLVLKTHEGTPVMFQRVEAPPLNQPRPKETKAGQMQAQPQPQPQPVGKAKAEGGKPRNPIVGGNPAKPWNGPIPPKASSCAMPETPMRPMGPPKPSSTISVSIPNPQPTMGPELPPGKPQDAR